MDNDTDDKQLCKIFSNFFEEVVKTLGVIAKFNMCNYSHSDSVNSTTKKHENRPSVKKISESMTITPTFHFSGTLSGVDKADAEKSIGNLNSSKVGTFRNILTKCLKVISDICSPVLTVICYQEFFLNKRFSQKLKLANITPVINLLVFYLQYKRSSND